jgi:hypothetical protein
MFRMELSISRTATAGVLNGFELLTNKHRQDAKCIQDICFICSRATAEVHIKQDKVEVVFALPSYLRNTGMENDFRTYVEEHALLAHDRDDWDWVYANPSTHEPHGLRYGPRRRFWFVSTERSRARQRSLAIFPYRSRTDVFDTKEDALLAGLFKERRASFNVFEGDEETGCARLFGE